MTNKITIPSFGGDDYEDQFSEFMREVILQTNVCPEVVPSLMDRCYRKEFGLSMDAVYAQFLEDD